MDAVIVVIAVVVAGTVAVVEDYGRGRQGGSLRDCYCHRNCYAVTDAAAAAGTTAVTLIAAAAVVMSGIGSDAPADERQMNGSGSGSGSRSGSGSGDGASGSGGGSGGPDGGGGSDRHASGRMLSSGNSSGRNPCSVPALLLHPSSFPPPSSNPGGVHTDEDTPTSAQMRDGSQDTDNSSRSSDAHTSRRSGDGSGTPADGD